MARLEQAVIDHYATFQLGEDFATECRVPSAEPSSMQLSLMRKAVNVKHTLL